MMINPKLIKSSIVFSIGWIIFFFVLTIVQGNGVFVIDFNTIILVFIFALIYNFILNMIIPGRYK